MALASFRTTTGAAAAPLLRQPLPLPACPPAGRQQRQQQPTTSSSSSSRSSRSTAVVARSGKVLHGDHGHGDHTVKWYERNKEMWTELTSDADFAQLLSSLQPQDGGENSNKLLVVDYYASWCAVCKTAYPALCRVADTADLKQRYVFAKASLDKSEVKDRVKAEGIKGIPHLAVYAPGGAKLLGMGASFKKVDAIKRNLALIAQHRDAVVAAGQTLPLDLDFIVMIPGVERAAVAQKQ